MGILFCALLLLTQGCHPGQTPGTAISPSHTAVPTILSTPTPTPTNTPMPTSTPLPLSGLVIGIDPGHQAKADYSKEPVSPGSKTMKAKVSSGTRGLISKVYEYEITLAVGLKLKVILQNLGATVVMTREKNDVNISNIQRAEVFNKAATDFAIRLHCNGNKNTNTNGAFMLIPTSNPYLSDCKRAAQIVLEAYCKKTGEQNLGITPRSDQSGFNFCNRMIVNIEMGYLTNAVEEHNLIDDKYQQKMAQGLADGILRYFGK